MSIPPEMSALVNVAQVKKLSPFRYPGGKTWLVPRVRKWLKSRRFTELLEPFAGGGIIGLTAVSENLVERATLVELDPDIAAVWETILGPYGGARWLSDRISNFQVSSESVRQVLDSEPTHVWQKAFVTILRNRCQRGGIMAKGAGLLKEGENGKGLLSRWYPETLAKRITEIARLRGRIVFLQEDAFKVLAANVCRQDLAIFVDPPYTVAARRLYQKWEVNHFGLFQMLRSAKGDFLMTYDKTEEVLWLSKFNGFSALPVAMKNTHHEVMDELLIGRKLQWLLS
jgi:DNA adenine methylase